MKIKLTGEFATLTGKREVEINGPTNIKQLLKALDSAYPNVIMETRGGWDNCNVAINGTMYADAWFQPINEDDEVVIMPPIEGG
jgi:MoaD family protein